MKKLSRRDFLKVSAGSAASVMAAAALTGCSSESDNETTAAATEAPSAEETAAAEEMDKRDELEASEDVVTGIKPELISGVTLSISSLTPFRNAVGQHAPVIKHLYDRLVYLDGDREFSLQAAKSIDLEDDGCTFDIEIYDNITDSEDNNITAADVVWFIEQYMENGWKTFFGKIENVEQTGDYTLQVKFIDDIAELYNFAFMSTFMVSQAAYEASADGFASYVVSSSPYRVTEFTAAASMTVERRDDYWMPEEIQGKYYKSNIRTLTELLVSEASQMQIALETGAVDVFPNINAEIVDAFNGNDQFYVCSSPSNEGYLMFFSGDPHSPCADDINLRKALCYAIDPQGIIDGALDGYGEAMHDITCRTGCSYVDSWDNEDYFPYSPETAAEYLAESDYNGEELVFGLATSNKNVATILQAYWQAVGINVTLDVLDTAMFSALVPSDYDITMTLAGNGCANMWSQWLDGTAFTYSYGNGDKLGRNDQELTDLLYYTWQNANYTDENIDKVHQYIMDNAYGRGLVLPLTMNVVNNDAGMVSTAYSCQGYLDVVSCDYEA